MSQKFRRAIIDIETAPNIGFFWGAGHDQNIPYENILVERQVICVCWKWHGEEKVHRISWDKDQNDRGVIKAVLGVLARADEVVAHNGARFDIPWLRSRALYHGFRNFPEVKVVDTLRLAWGKFRFNSNRLDYLAKFLKVGGKTATGFNLWKAVVGGNDRDALVRMVDYCANDVEVLERVYDKLAPYAKPASHSGVAQGKPVWSCPHCGSTNVKKNKTRITPSGTLQHVMVCKDCGSYYTLSNTAFKRYEKEKGSYV